VLGIGTVLALAYRQLQKNIDPMNQVKEGAMRKAAFITTIIALMVILALGAAQAQQTQSAYYQGGPYCSWNSGMQGPHHGYHTSSGNKNFYGGWQGYGAGRGVYHKGANHRGMGFRMMSQGWSGGPYCGVYTR
jgi:hypothetical protein